VRDADKCTSMHRSVAHSLGRMMTRTTKRVLRYAGVDARRYAPQSSERAMMERLLASYGVDCVFDVGANTGQYAEGLRNLGYKGRIISFEPLSAAHALLIENSRDDPEWVVAPPHGFG